MQLCDKMGFYLMHYFKKYTKAIHACSQNTPLPLCFTFLNENSFCTQKQLHKDKKIYMYVYMCIR